MKRLALLTALFLSTAGVSAASAASHADADPASGAESEAPAAQEPVVGHRTRVAEGFFENLWHGERHGERHGRHKGHWGDDDDDDEGGESEGHGRANGPVDPNAANAPVPDNGVFTGKARPKVEVQ